MTIKDFMVEVNFSTKTITDGKNKRKLNKIPKSEMTGYQYNDYADDIIKFAIDNGHIHKDSEDVIVKDAETGNKVIINKF